MTHPCRQRFNGGMEVANPIYDVVFKYLMQNQRVARLLIARITGLAVQSLTVSPQETSVHRTPDAPDRDLPLTLLRMDFAARVRTEDGAERQVLIEIQKSNAPTVIERFRRYLGQQIGSDDNILTHSTGRTEAVPIVTIYFLGYALDHLSDEAVIDVCPRVTERRTGRELEASHPLVEGIHHRSHIIQIPHLASRRRDELERLLAIFDQGLVKGNGRGDAHVLTIAEEEYPAECEIVLRQLHEAMAEEEVRRNMEGEDLLLRDSILLARQVEHRDRLLAQERQRAQRVEQERQQAEQERQQAEQERQQAEQERRQAEQERRQERVRAQRAEQAQQRAEQAQQQAEQAQQQAEQAQQQAEQAQQQAEQAQQRAEQERQLLLAQAIRRLHGLGQDAETISVALAVDADEVRRLLSE